MDAIKQASRIQPFALNKIRLGNFEYVGSHVVENPTPKEHQQIMSRLRSKVGNSPYLKDSILKIKWEDMGNSRHYIIDFNQPE